MDYESQSAKREAEKNAHAKIGDEMRPENNRDYTVCISKATVFELCIASTAGCQH